MIAIELTTCTANAILLPRPSSLNLSLAQLLNYIF